MCPPFGGSVGGWKCLSQSRTKLEKCAIFSIWRGKQEPQRRAVEWCGIEDKKLVCRLSGHFTLRKQAWRGQVNSSLALIIWWEMLEDTRLVFSLNRERGLGYLSASPGFWDKVSLWLPGCPGSLSIDQSGLELRDLPTFASLVLGSKVWATSAWH